VEGVCTQTGRKEGRQGNEGTNFALERHLSRYADGIELLMLDQRSRVLGVCEAPLLTLDLTHRARQAYIQGNCVNSSNSYI
jgi:hypothetical protein